MKNDFKIYLIGVIAVLLRSIEVITSKSQLNISEIILGVNMGFVQFNVAYLTIFMINSFPLILFQILMGIKIYKHFYILGKHCSGISYLWICGK